MFNFGLGTVPSLEIGTAPCNCDVSHGAPVWCIRIFTNHTQRNAGAPMIFMNVCANLAHIMPFVMCDYLHWQFAIFRFCWYNTCDEFYLNACPWLKPHGVTLMGYPVSFGLCHLWYRLNYTAKLLFCQSPTRHSDYTMTTSVMKSLFFGPQYWLLNSDYNGHTRLKVSTSMGSM